MRNKFCVIYDGECRICRTSVRFLKKIDWFHRFYFISNSKSDELKRILGDAYDGRQLDESIHVKHGHGKLYKGWEAVALLLRQNPLTWIMGAVGVLPGFKQLGFLIYRVIAANRHKCPHCKM